MPSRTGDTFTDRLATYILKSKKIDYKRYSFLERGSDERQYCWPEIDLPIASIMRSKYGEYPEYHTSYDDLNVISPDGLQGSYEVYKDCISLLENNEIYRCNTLCEPNLGKRNLYPTTSTLEKKDYVKDLLSFMMYSDGKNNLLDIAEILNKPIAYMLNLRDVLIKNELISVVI
jgi:aminopeptidase-like protein